MIEIEKNANRAFLHFFRIFLRLYAAIHVHGLIERLLLLAEERWRGSFQKPVKVMCRVGVVLRRRRGLCRRGWTIADI